ncbi:DUF2931 family protein [Pseudomonas sp. PCH199]|uniref:DUF2931 family protein n=1 Tax=unclassified Pseudomonas TaxID=196821 RepID=UPI000BDD5376|nr:MULTISPECIES: DUF2931 family protein [unclassified Pseudomonas]MCW8278470.1 DUF2931 family protein [Pseudomonas sp. PCH199]PAM81258.1 hypothetical protein CES87_25905 [Pseudomonas sp. ERMR1:02]
MNSLGRLTLLALILALTGCGNRLPYDSWYLGFGVPDYMDVWIETADAVDIHDRVFRRATSGVASIQRPKNLKGDPHGWPERPGMGAGKHVLRADLPRLIYVRWQSLVEPQTYEAYIPIPETTREAMLKGERTYCAADGKWITGYRDVLTVGLAPGGIARVWVLGACLKPFDVARVEGTVVKLGPSLGQNGGRYALPLKPSSKAYIEKFGIPYGSW